MHQILRVTWQVAPLQCPLIRRHCSRCKSAMPFACSMKFRTNAHKKRIDVWLIYRCSACDETWNLPIHERVTVGDIALDEFQAIARNDPALAVRHAFNRQRLAHHGISVEDSSAVAVRKSQESGCQGAALIEIHLALERPCQMRLDRLLSSELAVTRNQLRSLHESGTLRASHVAKPLRCPIADGQSVSIDLRDGAIQPDLAAIVRWRALE